MNKTDFDQGYDAGVLRALSVLDDADRELKCLDDDKSGFQRACYVRAICMAKLHMKNLMREQRVSRSPIRGDELRSLCEQLSLEPYQVRAIEKACGIT